MGSLETPVTPLASCSECHPADAEIAANPPTVALVARLSAGLQAAEHLKLSAMKPVVLYDVKVPLRFNQRRAQRGL